MKIQKKFLALSLILAFAIGFGACVVSQNLNHAAKKQQITELLTTSGDIARSTGYFEGLAKGMSLYGNCACDCPSCVATDDHPLTIIDTNNDSNDEAAANSNREKQLPILMNYTGTWLDQNAEPMSYADSERFFERNLAYAKVAVAINSLCVELQSDMYQHNLDRVSEWANAHPHDPEEYLDYEWILTGMEANYDYYLNDLLNLIGSEIDYQYSTADRTATHIILEKMLEFRADGTYDAAINPHRKHDCEAEGCNTSSTNPVLTSIPIVSDILALSDELTNAEIVALLDEQRTTSITQFDLQHPNIYFDQFGRVHGCSDPKEEYYYATSNGKVYQLDNNTNIERIGESPLFDASLRGTYVGDTNRILK